jgi:hypothetical protein
MSTNILKTAQPVVLDGYQAVMKPSKYGYSLSAIVDGVMVEKLEADRVDALKWSESKLKNPKRSPLLPEPWEEVAPDKYKVKFSWNDDTKVPVVDTEGPHITDETTPIYSGSTVTLAFYQKPYILKDGVTYGTSLTLLGIQLVSLSSEAGVDRGDLSAEQVVNLFGTPPGF